MFFAYRFIATSVSSISYTQSTQSTLHYVALRRSSISIRLVPHHQHGLYGRIYIHHNIADLTIQRA